MWLLDANIDVHLLSVFSEFGIPCESAIDKGWRELTNGQLQRLPGQRDLHQNSVERLSRVISSAVAFQAAGAGWKATTHDLPSEPASPCGASPTRRSGREAGP